MHKPAGGNHRAIEPGRILTIFRYVLHWDLRDIEDGQAIVDVALHSWFNAWVICV